MFTVRKQLISNEFNFTRFIRSKKIAIIVDHATPSVS
jgi:hypothetical protein